MTFSFRSLTLELTRPFLYAEWGRRSVFIKFRSGHTLWDFERRREEGGNLELWGFGMYVVAEGAAT